MRFTALFALAAAAAASVYAASNLAEQVGTVPAFLQLQKQYFANALSPDLEEEFIQLAKTIYEQNPKSLARLTGNSDEANELVQHLLYDAKNATEPAARAAAAATNLLYDAKNATQPAVRAESDAVQTEQHSVGSVPTFITLNQAASKEDASEEEVQALVQQGVTMLSEGYNERALRLLLGTSDRSTELLNKIVQAKSSA